MKNLLTIFALVLIGSYAYGQACTPTISAIDFPDGTFQPAPNPGLPCAIVGQDYSEVLQFIIPATFDFNGSNVDLDSIEVITVAGFPAEFGYQYGNSTGVWPSSTPGCAVFESASPATLGNHTIDIDAKIWATIATIPISIDTTVSDYIIRVKADQAAYDADTFCTNAHVSGIYNYELSGVNAMYNTPNPFMDNTDVKFTADNPADYTFQVHNLMGELVYEREITAGRGQNTIQFDGSELSSGVYFYNITDGNKALTTRMVKM